MSITRNLAPSIITSLRSEDLYNTKLLPDILFQKVFLAIRNNSIDFYHKGGLLFSYDISGFKTHIKYAAVIPNMGRDYLTQAELNSYKLATDFVSNYERIKENCANYSGIEALGVSSLYHNYSYLSANKLVVLDIEVAFLSLSGNRKMDRIDILLYNTSKKKLQFVEAKHFSNTEIFSTTKPKVINQISSYENQIISRKADIISAYGDYIGIVNKIFVTSLPKPVNIDDQVTLLIFGFDEDQKRGRLRKLILDNPEYKGIKTYCKGDIKDTKMSSIWNAKVL